MGVGKPAKNHGYTLMELMMAMAIITVISAVAVPNYTRYIASTREKVCIINRQTILYEYHLYCITEPEITLSEYLSDYYTGDEGQICTSDGTYTASGTGETAELTCSVHRKVIIETTEEAFLN